jgi:hypothetical protein
MQQSDETFSVYLCVGIVDPTRKTRMTIKCIESDTMFCFLQKAKLNPNSCELLIGAERIRDQCTTMGQLKEKLEKIGIIHAVPKEKTSKTQNGSTF